MSTGNIFLVGLMGAGKTTIGRTLARRLNKRFIDSDHEIEARTGASIPWIFEIEGEANFRRREAEVIRDLVAQDGIVLATGGGAILDPESRRLLRSRGTVVYLRSSVNAILARTAHDRNRPLLQTADPRRKLEELTAQRDPLYREIAHIIVDSGRGDRDARPDAPPADAPRADVPRADAPRPNVQSVVQSIISQIAALDEGRAKAARAMNQTAQTAQAAQPATLRVELGERSYPIVVGPGVLGQPLLASYVAGSTAAIVTNDTVAPLYLERVAAPLRAAGKQVVSVVLPDGEQYKDWASLAKIYDALLANKCDRKTTVVALGGGVIGDMAGFAAATYMRGVPFVQVPTTLLAQVDSSVGGKTGINHPLGKNMIGAFYQPVAVLADTAVFATLPDRELSAGLAEVIKHGAIADPAYFGWIEQNIGALRARDPAALVHAVVRSCEIKADVVRQDERESGLRAILNFGHTFGHAIEAGLGFGTWLHGEAVGCGMVLAADLSARLGYIDATAAQRIRALVERAGLPVRAPDFGEARWLELMQLDKKNEAGAIRFVLLKPLGSAVVEAVPAPALSATLAACTR